MNYYAAINSNTPWNKFAQQQEQLAEAALERMERTGYELVCREDKCLLDPLYPNEPRYGAVLVNSYTATQSAWSWSPLTNTWKEHLHTRISAFTCAVGA